MSLGFFWVPPVLFDRRQIPFTKQSISFSASSASPMHRRHRPSHNSPRCLGRRAEEFSLFFFFFWGGVIIWFLIILCFFEVLVFFVFFALCSLMFFFVFSVCLMILFFVVFVFFFVCLGFSLLFCFVFLSLLFLGNEGERERTYCCFLGVNMDEIDKCFVGSCMFLFVFKVNN